MGSKNVVKYAPETITSLFVDGFSKFFFFPESCFLVQFSNNNLFRFMLTLYITNLIRTISPMGVKVKALLVSVLKPDFELKYFRKFEVPA